MKVGFRAPLASVPALPDDAVPAIAVQARPIASFEGLSRGGAGRRALPIASPALKLVVVPQESSVTAPVSTARPPSLVKGSRMFSLAVSNDVDESPGQYDDAGSTPRRRSVSGGAPTLKIEYTDEQNEVIECDDRLIVVDALAGCGKTTTAEGFARHRPNERILYMCLNTANAKEAQSRFGPNVVAATTHGVAWRAMKPDRARITTRWKPILLVDQLGLNNARDGMITMRILADFFNSADVIISEKHAEQVAYERDLTAQDICNGVALACLAWKRMNDPADKLQMPHDAYLKMFALRAPKLEYSTIIFDEAQDANPVTLQIINGQRHSKLLCIGDRHQSIYQFRGSVNAMEKLTVGSTHLHLSNTWRFGPKVAETANLVLGELKGEKVKIKGLGTDGVWDSRQVTTLSRTNAELFRIAAEVRGEGVHWVGGPENYRLDLVMDAYHLYARERTLIKDPLMSRKFVNWDEYVKYAEDANDSEARVLAKVVEEFTDGIPQLVDDIRDNAVPTSQDASLTLTTAHKGKGMEWDYVRISNDFEVLEEAENVIANHPGSDMPIQDINLLYVTLTRARKAIELNDETVAWIDKLPIHRANREAAATRQQGLINAQRENLLRTRQA